MLSDKDKRARYDQFGHAGVDPNFGGGAGGWQPASRAASTWRTFSTASLAAALGAAARRARTPTPPGAAAMSTANIAISFEEAAKGCKKTVSIHQIDTCDQCHGTGAAAGTSPKTCPSTAMAPARCAISQRTPFGVVQSSQTCDRCGGTGKIDRRPPAQTCDGKGQVRRPQEHGGQLCPPASTTARPQCLRRPRATPASTAAPAATVHVYRVGAARPAVRAPDGYDVWCDMPITFTQAALGRRCGWSPTMDGKVKLPHPRGHPARRRCSA